MKPSEKLISVREMVLFGILGSMTFGAKYMMSFLPNIEPVSLCVMLYAVVFGKKWVYPVFLSVESEVDQESGYAKVLISLDEKADIREELSLALAEQKIPVMSMVLEEKTLEDIFIELTGSDDDLAVKKTKKGDR